MKTIKEIEREHTNCFAVGYNICRDDVLELIYERLNDERKIDDYDTAKFALEELKSRIIGK